MLAFAACMTVETITAEMPTATQQSLTIVEVGDSGPCVEEMPVLQEIAGQYADELTLLGINLCEPANEFIEQE